jgi:hypothetical protein
MLLPMDYTWPRDIQAKITHDFEIDLRAWVYGQLEVLCSQGGGFRLIRCVLHLAQGSMEDLRHFVEQACLDSRDVISWAEYDAQGRVRDYNYPFPANEQ